MNEQWMEQLLAVEPRPTRRGFRLPWRLERIVPEGRVGLLFREGRFVEVLQTVVQVKEAGGNTLVLGVPGGWVSPGPTDLRPEGESR